MSTLLMQHPRIYYNGEIFRRPKWKRVPLLRDLLLRFPEPFIWYRRLRALPIQATFGSEQSFYGFKLFYGHVLDTVGLVHRLHSKGWHILYLERRSAFDQVISKQVAHKTRRFHGYGHEEPEIEPLYLDPQLILDSYRQHISLVHKCRAAVAPIPHLSLVYEDDLQDSARWPVTAHRIYSAFGLDMPAQPLTVRLNKPWSRPYAELVTNFAELRAMIEQEEATPATGIESNGKPQ